MGGRFGWCMDSKYRMNWNCFKKKKRWEKITPALKDGDNVEQENERKGDEKKVYSLFVWLGKLQLAEMGGGQSEQHSKGQP